MNWGLLRLFVSQCEALDVTPPAAAIRGLALVEVMNAHAAKEPVSLLSLTDEGIREHVDRLTLRRPVEPTFGGPLIDHVTMDLSTELAREVREASRQDLDRIVDDLSSRFVELAAPIVIAAQDYGYSLRTTSDEVILRADERASAAWRNLRAAWARIQPIVALRIDMSRTFEVAPLQSIRKPPGSPVDYTICFTRSDTWSTNGEKYVDGNVEGEIDWLALAIGGLELVGPSEVASRVADRDAATVRELAQRYQEAAAARQSVGEPTVGQYRPVAPGHEYQTLT